MFDDTPIAISDPGDPRLADYRQLNDPAARRRIEGNELFVAEGPVAVERLLASGHRVRSVLLSHEKHARMANLVAGTTTYVVSRELLREIVGFDLHRGAIAAADRRPQPRLAEVLTTAHRIAVLEGLNDPENLGAIARSARALGIDALVLDPTCIDPYTRRTVRVSMGEILFLPVARVATDDWPRRALDQVRDAGFATWALTPAADAADIWTLDVPDRLAMLLGAEGPGLAAATLAAARPVRLPIRAGTDSLNVGAAAAVAFAVTGREKLSG